MMMTNDENAAPLSINVNLSPVVVKITDALSVPKSSLRRGTKRTRDSNEEKRIEGEEEVKACAPVSKKAKIEAWWRDAASTLGNVRSSVSESMVAKHAVTTISQVGGQVAGALRKLPTWIQSGGGVAKTFLKTAITREGKIQASEVTKATLDSGAAITSTSHSSQIAQSCEDSSAPLETITLNVVTTCVESPVPQNIAQVSAEEVVPTTANKDASINQVELQSELSNVVDSIEEVPAVEDIDTMLDSQNIDANSGDLEYEEVLFPEEVLEQVILQPEAAHENPDAVADDSFLGDEEVAMSDEVLAFEQDVEEGGMDQAEMMPQLDAENFDPAFVNEANQAEEVDYIVDSQGVEWFPVHDNATGFVYYWNQRTGETTWQRPVTSAEAAFGA